MSEKWRPPFCPDPTGCAPVIHPLTDSDNMTLDQRGFAVFCFGRLAEPLVWTFDGVEHRETLSTCQSSPLKGVVRWLENEADWSAMLRSYRAAIAAVHAPERAAAPVEPTWPSREEVASMDAATINEFLASRGLDVRVADPAAPVEPT